MKNKFLLYVKNIFCLLLSMMLAMSFPLNLTYAKSSKYTADDLEKVIDGVLAYKQSQAKVSGIQELIDTEIVNKAGRNNNTEWFVIALCRYKTEYDYSNYISALRSYVKEAKNANATDLQRMALAFSAVGENTSYINKTIKSTIGKLGIMSEIYGLILLDSREYSVKEPKREDVLQKILSSQLKDGGWALNGSTSDADVTAMAIQALSPYYTENSTVKDSVDQALACLSKMQLKTGDYKSYGVRSCESTAQVIAALSTLGIDCQTDTRFIKKNKTLFDGLMLYKKSDGSFRHTIDGKSNETASIQAMYSLIAAWRQYKAMESIYTFDDTKTSNTESKLESSDQQNQSVIESKLTADHSQNQASISGLAGDDNVSTSTEIPKEKGFHFDYKSILSILIVAFTLLVLGMHHILNRLSRKKMVMTVGLAAIAMLLIWTVKFQSVEDYYQTSAKDSKVTTGSVFLSIRCDTIVGKKDNDNVTDGIILDKAEVPLHEGDSVLDALIFASKQNQIPLDYEGNQDSGLSTAYVRGINHLYEEDYGEQSGWLYSVNNKFPGVDCGDYQISDHDVIEWVYTCDLGKDVGRE